MGNSQSIRKQLPKSLIEMLGNSCNICGALTGNGRGYQLSIDHDHKTDIVRGLLCGHCNVGIALFKDSPELLRAAALYLEPKI